MLKLNDSRFVLDDKASYDGVTLEGSTSSDYTIYVSTTGSDLTGDGTLSKPYATRQKAYDSLPKFIDNKITIQLAAGIYTELARFPTLTIAPNSYVRVLGTLDRSSLFTCTGGDDINADGYAVFEVAGESWTANEHAGKMIEIVTQDGSGEIYSKYIPVHSNDATKLYTPQQYFTPSGLTTFYLVSPLTVINASGSNAEIVNRSTVDSNSETIDGVNYFKIEYGALKFLNPAYAIKTEGSFYKAEGIWIERTTTIEVAPFFSQSGASSFVTGVYASGKINSIASNMEYCTDYIYNVVCDFSGYDGSGHIYPFSPASNSVMLAAQFVLQGSAAKKINSVMIANSYGTSGILYRGRVDYANNILRSINGGNVSSFEANSIYGANNGKLYNIKADSKASYVSQSNLTYTTEVDTDDSGSIARYISSQDEYLDITGMSYNVTAVAGTSIASARKRVNLTPASAVTMTATPSIVAGIYIGQELMLYGTSDTNHVTLQDETLLAGSKIKLKVGNSITLGLCDAILFKWDGTYWCEDSRATRSFSRATEIVSDNTTLNHTHYRVLVDDGSTITLPSAVGIKGREYNIIRVGSSSVPIATTGGQTISGDAGLTLVSQYDSVVVVSDNTNWIRCS